MGIALAWISFHPSIHTKWASRIQIIVVRYIDVGVDSIEAERLLDLTPCECRSTLQRAVIAALDIIGIVVARPPGDHLRRWVYTGSWLRLALTISAGVVDALDLGSRKGTVEEFDFVYQTAK